MFDRKTTRFALILLSLWVVRGKAAFAQDEDPQAAIRAAQQQEAQRQAQERRAIEEDRQRRERSIAAMNEFMKDGRSQITAAANAAENQRLRDFGLELDRFRLASSKFDIAREELSEALGFKAKLKDPARKLAKSTGALLDFIKRTNKEPVRFDPAEFKDFTPTELGWEALASAERVSPRLANVIQTESQASVDVRFLLSLSKLQAELLRLQWVAQRLK